MDAQEQAPLSELEQLKWKKFPVFNDGFVCLVDAMGCDQSVVRAARTSYGNEARGDFAEALASKDRTLLRYLMRHRHSTPFEMAELIFLVRVPMDTWRQWIRHRTASVNEYSTRYAEAIDSRQTTPEEGWRLQSVVNKQGSSGAVVTDQWPEGYKICGIMQEDVVMADHELTDQEKRIWRRWAIIRADGSGGWEHTVTFNNMAYEDVTPGRYLSHMEMLQHHCSQSTYEERLKFGVAKEVARKDLPLSTYTEAYWKTNLHNLLHFLGLRMDAHAQLEIRTYANIMGNEILAKLFPETWQAFRDYRLDAMSLTRLDLEVMAKISNHLATCGGTSRMSEFPLRLPHISDSMWPDEWRDRICRERDECIAKLQRMGFIQTPTAA